jgi:hypothetical protein
MTYARRQALKNYATEEAQGQWETWRQEARQQELGQGPVARRTPKSAEPPALVLMRDYFAVCVVIAVTLTSVLFVTFLALVRGALTTPHFVDRSPPEPHRDGSD